MKILFSVCIAMICATIVNADFVDAKSVLPETVGLSSQRLKNIDTLTDKLIDEKKMAGTVVLIARHGKIAYFKATGLADTDKPMEKDTIMRVMSMSKPITSVATMLLYEQGKLLLSDPVSKYIPEFKNQKVLVPLQKGSPFPYKLLPVKREVTIRDLLAHTSGIMYLSYAGIYPNEPGRQDMLNLYKGAQINDGYCRSDEEIGEMVKRLGRLPLTAQPGEVWEYGLNSDVLGYLVEVVSGVKFDKFVEQNIFKPLKMNDSYFYLPEEKINRLAAVYKSDWNGTLERVGEHEMLFSNELAMCPYDAYQTSGKYLSGGGGVLSTAYDYFRFCQMLLNGGELDGVRLLSRKTVELMSATNHSGQFDATYLHGHGWKFGLGFAIQQDREHDVDAGDVGVFEWAGLYSTRFSVDPKEDKITIFFSQTTPFGHHFDLWDKLLVLSGSAISDSTTEGKK
ncbi:MAG: serine hydrolase [Campylobacterales bacterium]|nr:serine hydrolase [Campylobacterales bacterium]